VDGCKVLLESDELVADGLLIEVACGSPAALH